MLHRLKILPAHFEAVKRGEKNFEIRDNSDRGFQKGDTVILQEYQPDAINPWRYTGQEIMIEITYVTNFQQPENQVVFGFCLIPSEEDNA